MIDAEFEASTKILSNDGYFARHRNLASVHGVEQAWRIVEDELPFGLRRFTSFHAFEAAKARYISGKISATVTFKLRPQ